MKGSLKSMYVCMKCTLHQSTNLPILEAFADKDKLHIEKKVSRSCCQHVSISHDVFKHLLLRGPILISFS